MKKKSTLVLLGLAALLLVLASGTGLAKSPTPATVTGTASPQLSSQGIIPCKDGSGQHCGLAELTTDQVFYLYSFTQGSGFTDSIPVNVCTTSTTGTYYSGTPPQPAGTFTAYAGYDSATSGVIFSWSPDGGGGTLPSGDYTLPTIPTFNSDTCHLVNILLDFTTLTAGTYNLNFHLASQSVPNNVTSDVDGPTNVHIVVDVAEPEGGPTCFITDSDFNFLLDCSSKPVGTDGTFRIVTNKKGIEVSTNPGQFYYNLLWTNDSGTDQTVSVNFARYGVSPHGAQAIHAGLFPPPFSGETLENFNTVNDAIPSGHDDSLESVTVPDGWTLWVDYHLQWSDLGSSAAAGISGDSCSANACFKVEGSIVTQSGTLGPCTAGACGYKK
jgi:hypothetical protein